MIVSIVAYCIGSPVTNKGYYLCFQAYKQFKSALLSNGGAVAPRAGAYVQAPRRADDEQGQGRPQAPQNQAPVNTQFSPFVGKGVSIG